MHSLRIMVFAFVFTSGCAAVAGEIHLAVHENNVSKVKKLIENSPEVVFSKDEDGFTPLHVAAANGYRGMAELLLASKADVNSKDNAGSTPLHQAVVAQGQHLDLVEMLIANKADVNAADKIGLTPLHYATLANNLDAVKSLLRHGANVDAKDSQSLCLCAEQSSQLYRPVWAGLRLSE